MNIENFIEKEKELRENFINKKDFLNDIVKYMEESDMKIKVINTDDKFTFDNVAKLFLNNFDDSYFNDGDNEIKSIKNTAAGFYLYESFMNTDDETLDFYDDLEVLDDFLSEDINNCNSILNLISGYGRPFEDEMFFDCNPIIIFDNENSFSTLDLYRLKKTNKNVKIIMNNIVFDSIKSLIEEDEDDFIISRNGYLYKVLNSLMSLLMIIVISDYLIEYTEYLQNYLIIKGMYFNGYKTE